MATSRSARPGMASVRLPIDLIHEWSAATTFNAALDATAKWLPELIDRAQATICLLTPDRLGLEVFMLSADTAVRSGTILPIAGSAVGAATTTRSVINVPSIAESSYIEAPMLSEAGLKSTLCAPLVTAGECFGTLNVGRAQINGFDTEDELLVGSVGEVIGSTLLNLRRIETERNLSRIDQLTGLASRRHILEILTDRVRHGDGNTPVLFMDLDGFKLINDAYGHATGDLLLEELGQRFRATCEPDHQVGRIGGDEFLVIGKEGSDRGDALSLAHRLLEVCEKPVTIGSIDLQPQMSVGLAIPARDGVSVAELLAQADQAMYEAKRSDQSLVEADEHLRRDADLIAAIDRDLDTAIASDSMEFYYQPIRNLASNEMLGCEALLRWFHPDVGLVPPALLIARAEATDRIDALTTWAIDRAARDWSEMRATNRALDDKAFSFNLSPRQLAWRGYVDAHLDVLERHQLRPQDIIIEIIESGQIEVDTVAETTIRDLAARGVIIALDDFGTGHNVIGYFSRFPVHAIKIDRSMIAAMVDNPTARTVVKGLSQIATDLGFVALGEGIETQEEFDTCISAGVVEGQGYLLGHPMSVDALINLIEIEFPTTHLAVTLQPE